MNQKSKPFPLLIAILATIATYTGLTITFPLLLWVLYGDFVTPPAALQNLLLFALAPLLARAMGIYQYRRTRHQLTRHRRPAEDGAQPLQAMHIHRPHTPVPLQTSTIQAKFRMMPCLGRGHA